MRSAARPVWAAAGVAPARSAPSEARRSAVRVMRYAGRRAGGRLGLGGGARQAEGERAALADGALHRDVAAEQAGEPARDGETEACARSGPRRRRLDLPEGFEDALEVL